MTAGTIAIKIKNWATFNPRSDVKQSSWFRLQHSIIEDPDFFDFSAEEFKAWIYILCQASKKSSPRVIIHFEHANRVSRIQKRYMESAIQKLQLIGTLLVDVTSATVTDTSANATDERDETRRDERTNGHFDFDAFWKLYPRKIKKPDALARFKVLIRTEVEYRDLLTALANFRAHHESRGTEAQYIPHPTTFLGTKDIQRWREWLDAETGTSDLKSSNGVRSIADILAEEEGRA